MRFRNLYCGYKTGALSKCVMASLALIAASGTLNVCAEEFQPEQLKDGTNLPADMSRIYVSDFSIGHLMDGRTYILDAKTGRYAGGIDGGYAGQFALSPDGKQAYVATTYLSRHSHGERTDVLELYDTGTLRLQGDVILPKKHAQALYSQELLRTSFDGRYVYVQNATPATSVTVVDLKQRKVLAEVPSPGCWALFPSQTYSLRYSMLCGDGTLNTVTLNEDGSVLKRAPSTRFFDGEKDPVFINAADDGANYYFLSFNGNLTKATLSEEQPVIGATVALVQDNDRKRGWRPGGYQLQALHRASGRLFIGMHPNGKEGTHKNPAQEIWGIDLKSGKLLSRLKASNATVLSVNQDAPGYLYALDGSKNQIHAYDLNNSLRAVYVTEPVGEVPIQVYTP